MNIIIKRELVFWPFFLNPSQKNCENYISNVFLLVNYNSIKKIGVPDHLG